MDMSGRDNSPERGVKRKYTGDGPDVRGPDKFATTTDIRVSSVSSSAVPEPPVSTTDLASGLSVPKNDDYYKTLYIDEPDFRVLGQRDPEFKAVLQRGSHLDFADPKSVMLLTKTLLKLDFGLVVDLPMDRLCPPVPNRHNYILWLKELLDSSSPACLGSSDPARNVVGLDIGTGASLIYPLLGCAQRPSWSFIATDVDAKSLAYARKNVQLNNLGSRIRVVGRSVTDCLIPMDELAIEAINFVMVNPPFYTSEAELLDLARQKSRPPNTACTGAPIEMVCDGGEIGFVRRIIDESLVLKERVQWYTSMLGKQSSLGVLVDALKGHGVTNYAVTAFVQGNKTRRWAIGWSFGSRRPSLSASRGCEPSAGKKLLPPPTEAMIGTWRRSQATPEQLQRAICDTMESLDLVSWTWDKPLSRGVGFANGNVWSRSYRRKRARERGSTDSTSERVAQGGIPYSQKGQLGQKTEQHIAKCAFGFSVTIMVSRDTQNDADQSVVMARWLQGSEYALFESFVGLLRTSIHPA
ncbi:hypothetical protein F5Y13DRAFT_160207 [Hypoxylon sp. FL1857]|nr:hypothetical protein F5Y13DRAFT_160207 [Hypoxylon sp. FL1857]